MQNYEVLGGSLVDNVTTIIFRRLLFSNESSDRIIIPTNMSIIWYPHPHVALLDHEGCIRPSPNVHGISHYPFVDVKFGVLWCWKEWGFGIWGSVCYLARHILYCPLQGAGQ